MKITSASCGVTDSCANWLFETSSNVLFSTTYSIGSKTLTTGYNKILFSSTYSVNKGEMLYLYVSNANLIAVDESDDTIISDYEIDSGKITKLDISKNSRFYVTALIDVSYYMIVYDFTRVYTSPGVYNITCDFMHSNVTLNRYFGISNSNIILLFSFFSLRRLAKLWLNDLQ